MSFCRVPRNTNKEIQAVYASNKEESKLYKDLVTLFPNKEEALTEYAKILTGEFKNWFSNSKYIDTNDEPVIQYDNIGRPYYINNLSKRYYIKKEDRSKLPLEEYQQGAQDKAIIKDLPRAKREDLGDYESFDRINQIRDKNKDISLNEADLSNTFYERGATKFKRLTEWVTENLSSDSKKSNLNARTPEEWAALKYYEKRTIPVTSNIVWDEDGKEHSFDEIKEFFRLKNKISTSYGTIIHLIIQKKLTGNKNLDKEISKAIKDSNIEEWKFQWLDDNYLSDLMYEYLDLNLGENFKDTGVEDKIASEVTVGSEILGIGTKVDGIVEHSNGSISLVDFKTGQYFLSDAGTTDQMKYGNLIDEIIKDSKLDKAKMELALRALMIKEQNPDIKFRNIQIAHIGLNQVPRIYDVSIKNYLQVLSEYFKNNDKEKYDLLNNKNLFDFSQYTSEIKEVAENEQDKYLSTEEKLVIYQNELFRLQSLPKNERKNIEVQDKINELTSVIHDLTKSVSADFKSDTTDTGIVERWFGTFYEQANPIAQNFIRLFQKEKFSALKEINKFKDLQQAKLKPIIDEYYRKYPLKKIANKGVAGGIVYHSNDNTGLFDFMWEKKTSGEREGYYARVITEDQVKRGLYSQAQFDYNKWYRESLKNIYDSTMKVKVGDKTKEELTFSNNFKFDPNFMPRIPMDGEDIVEKFGFFSKENLSQQVRNQTDFFIKEQYRTQRWDGIGQPIKFIGSPSIISNSYHSFNAEEAIVKFATNMIYKKHLDGISALGQGTLQLIKDEVNPENGKERYPGTYKWLESYIKQQVDSKNDEISTFRKPLTLNINGKKYNINPERVMDGANNMVTASTMWLNIPGGTFNSFLNLMFSSKEAIKGSIAKRLGVDISDIDYTISDFIKAVSVWFKSGILVNFKGNIIEDYTTAANKDKLHRFMRLMDFDTNSFKYGNKKGDLLSAKNRLLSRSTMYMFHSIGEEFALMTTLSATLNRMKLRDGAGNYIDLNGKKVDEKNATSMWDAYDFNENGEFEYKGPQRGILTSGEKLMGLTSEEINKIRRYSQRVYGGYREDERTAAEQYALGRWALKFKKFIPALITSNFQRKFNDWSIGKYEQLHDTDGNPIFADGQPVIDWVTQVNEGRVWVTLKFLTYSLASKFVDNTTEGWDEYRWENLNSDQRKQIVDMGVAFTLMLSMILAGRWFFPDEEDKNLKIYKRYHRLIDDVIQINPIDLTRNFTSPLLQTQMAYKVGEAMSKYFFNGVILGERLKTGPNKGNLPGSTVLKQRLPFISIPNQFGVFEDEDPDNSLPILETR